MPSYKLQAIYDSNTGLPAASPDGPEYRRVFDDHFVRGDQYIKLVLPALPGGQPRGPLKRAQHLPVTVGGTAAVQGKALIS